jgi:hypothetical protein
LLCTDYWEDVQHKLRRGEVLELRMYPESSRLRYDVKLS